MCSCAAPSLDVVVDLGTMHVTYAVAYGKCGDVDIAVEAGGQHQLAELTFKRVIISETATATAAIAFK